MSGNGLGGFRLTPIQAGMTAVAWNEPGSIPAGEVLTFDVHVINNEESPLTFDEAILVVSGPLDHRRTLYAGNGVRVRGQDLLSTELSLPVPETVPSGEYSVEVVLSLGGVELSRDGFEVTVISPAATARKGGSSPSPPGGHGHDREYLDLTGEYRGGVPARHLPPRRPHLGESPGRRSLGRLIGPLRRPRSSQGGGVWTRSGDPWLTLEVPPLSRPGRPAPSQWVAEVDLPVAGSAEIGRYDLEFIARSAHELTLNKARATVFVERWAGNRGLRINEVCAFNLTGITDGAGEHEDWLELINTEADAISLADLYLTDDFSEDPLNGSCRRWCWRAKNGYSSGSTRT